MTAEAPAPDSAAPPLPDFCRPRRLLALMAAAEVFALIFALIIPAATPGVLVARILLVSVYLQLISLLSAAASHLSNFRLPSITCGVASTWGKSLSRLTTELADDRAMTMFPACPLA